MTSAATRRPVCPRCERPQRSCICGWITPTANQVEVLVLQHPLEVHQAKGSARLLQLSLQHCRLQVGERLDEQVLHELILAGGKQALLLYPDDENGYVQSCVKDGDNGTVVDPTRLVVNSLSTELRLVVLDGTWRKSRKMLHLNPLLRSLPRMALKAPPASRYAIRKAHRSDQLSTLEATCLALQQLELAPLERYAPLLTAFDGFVAQMAGWAVPAAAARSRR